jgi:glycosyltransferase involved in cell wall biosynthesis
MTEPGALRFIHHSRVCMGSEQLWVVAACFNEEIVITRFIERVLAQSEVHRLLLIDDGSSDATVEVVRTWLQSNPEQGLTLLELTRNFGKEAAMLAGLDYADGRCGAALLIDSDLQHPPERIPAMVKAWREGAEVVTAVRDDRDAEGLVKVATASWFYRVFNRLVDSIQLQEGAGDFRLLSAPVIQAVTQMREATRFSKGLMPWTGYRSVEIPYSRVARSGGASSWSSLKLWRYALDGIFSFSVKPLKVWGVIGVLISFLSFLYAALIVLRTLIFGVDLPGYASLIVAVLFLGGIQLIGIGVLGEYIGRIYIDVKRRPHYFIRAVHES